MRQSRHDFRNVTVRYHRNGVSGLGFHALSFQWKADTRNWRHMCAVIREESGDVAVIDPRNIAECWRGDDFEPMLRRLIEEGGDNVYRPQIGAHLP